MRGVLEPGGRHAAATSTGTTALHTDHYELTMLTGAVRAGMAEHRCVFEVFCRRLPRGRRYGVLAGVGRLVEALGRYRFTGEDLEWLQRAGVIDAPTAAWLEDRPFRATVSGYADGETYFPGSPVLTVEGAFGDAVLLETLVLSVLNHDAAIAAAAARMVSAADGRVLLEMGSRRTHEDAAVAAAAAAYLAGFTGTSNLAAGARYGIPTSGTSAHAFTLLFGDERSAFAAQVAVLGPGTTLLVDTYDVEAAIRTAVEVAGTALGAVRLDSGDLDQTAHLARRLLDELGATDTGVVVTGDLDEHVVARLSDGPATAFGVGTHLVTGSGAPTAEFVYKLVATAGDADPATPLRPVAKRSAEKATLGGRKRAWRERDPDGTATAEVVVVDPAAGPPPGSRELQVPLLVDGVPKGPDPVADLQAARAHHRMAMAELPAAALRLDDGPPAVPTRRTAAPTA